MASGLLPTHDLVIDTNVVLDWLLFRNPVGALLEEALMSGQFRWLCTHAMRDELARVAARESLARWAIDAEALMSAFDARAMGHDMPPTACNAPIQTIRSSSILRTPNASMRC